MALAMRTIGIEVMIARADDDLRQGPQLLEIVEDDDDLRAGIDRRGDVEHVAGKDDKVIGRRSRYQPVELGQGIMEIGNDQDFQGAPLGGGHASATL